MISDKTLTSNLITDRKRRYQHRKTNDASGSGGGASSSSDSMSSSSENLRSSTTGGGACENNSIGEIILKSSSSSNNNAELSNDESPTPKTPKPRVETSQQENEPESPLNAEMDLLTCYDESSTESDGQEDDDVLNNDYDSIPTTTTLDSQNNGEDDSPTAAVAASESSKRKQAVRVPKINLQQTSPRVDRFDSTSFVTDRFTTESRTDRTTTEELKTGRASRGNSLEFRKRLNSLLKKENKTDMYMTNMQELIENSQNKLGEEVTSSDKDYEIMKIINRGTDRLIHKISLDEDDQEIKDLEHEYSTDEVYIFRDIGAEFKVFCPTIFQHLRKLFKVSEFDFKKQMGCHTGNYSRVGTPGKSGAFFFITKSSGYLLKSVTEEELATSLEIMPNYHKHVQKNPYTLLSNFYLLFEITLKQAKYRFVVMNNVFFTPLTIHRKYDLKGSTAGRVASESERKKKSPILKDKDINQGDVKLNLTLKQNFYRRLENDVIFLQENDIMDYSLLLGVHSHDQRLDEENKMVSKFKLPQPDDTSFSGRQKNYCSSHDGKEIYYIGIIDILQKYNSRKQMEKVVKSGMQSLKAKIRNATKEKVSVEKPFKYGQRFENYLKILCSTVSLKDFKPGTPKSYNQRKDISEEFYHLLIRDSQKDFKAFFFRGLFYHNPRVGDMVNAVSDYTKSIKLNPQYSNVSSYLFRSLLYLTAANSILEKRGDEIRYVKYANFAFKDMMKLIEMNQYCADAYLLRGVLWMYKFKYHLLFGKSTPQEEKINQVVKESALAQFYFKKNFSNFSSIDIASISDLYTCLGDATSKTASNFAMIRNLPSIRKIMNGLEENERVLFYPRTGKILINIRSETLVLNYRTGNDNSSISTAKSSKSAELDGETEVEKEKQEFIRPILEYVHHQDEQLYKLAEKDFLKSIQINPSLHDPYGFQKMSQRLDLECYNAYTQLAMLYLDLDRPDDAEKILSESVKKAEKKSHSSYFMRGNIYAFKYLALEDKAEHSEKAKEYLALAIQDYEKCLSLDPNSHKAWYNMATLYKSNNPEKAEECYTKCIEISEGFFFAIHNRALLYKNVLPNNTQRREKAIIDLTQCITLDPLNTSCYILRANTYLDMNNPQSAEMDFKQAIHIDPNCSSAYYELAKLNLNNEEKCKYYTSQFKTVTKRGGEKKVNDIPLLLQY